MEMVRYSFLSMDAQTDQGLVCVAAKNTVSFDLKFQSNLSCFQVSFSPKIKSLRFNQAPNTLKLGIGNTSPSFGMSPEKSRTVFKQLYYHIYHIYSDRQA